MLLLFIPFAIAHAAILFSHGRVRYYALTGFLHVLKLNGLDCTILGIYFTVCLCTVSFRCVRVQNLIWYEYTFDTSSVHRPAFSWDCDVPHVPFLGWDDYELYRSGLLHWPHDGVTEQVSLCLFGVNEVIVKKRKPDIIPSLKEYKVLLCWSEITQTPVLLPHEDPSLLVAAHKFHTEPHYSDNMYYFRSSTLCQYHSIRNGRVWRTATVNFLS